MSKSQVDLHPAELLTAIHNNLHKRFFELPKNDAKQQYRKLESGMEIPFMKISAPDHGEVSCKLALDHTQFVGNLNFSQFRNILASHLQRIAVKLSKKEDLNIFTSEETSEMIFHIPGVVESGDTVNILVTGVDQRVAGNATVRLMFLDPERFSTGSG